jgi:hypothetical protein
MSRSADKVNDLYLVIALSAFLAMIYLLTFSGQFRSIDEFAMYAQTESLARGNGLDTPQLAFARRHNYVGNIEPGQSLLAVPLYYLAQLIPGASNIAAVMLLNVLVTSITGGMLFMLLRRLDFSQAISVATALACGIGTTAWPYARSFFREPLNGLVWVTAALLCVAWNQTRKAPYILGCALILCAGLAIKSSSAAAIPAFALVLLWDARKGRFALSRKSIGLFVIAGLAAVSFGLLLHSMNMARPLIMLRRRIWPYPLELSLIRAYGAFFSPLKGLIFYSPILLATVVGWPSLVRRHRSVAFLIAGVTLGVLAIYGTFVAWHGGHIVWGPRYHLPLLALLLIPYASALTVRSIAARIWVGVWSAIGLLFQLAAGTTAWIDTVWRLASAYSGEDLIGFEGIPWYSWRLIDRSPPIAQLLEWNPRRLDISWLRTLTDGSLAFDPVLGSLLVVLTGLVLAGLLILLFKRSLERRFAVRIAAGALLLVTVATVALLIRSGQNTNDHWGLTRSEAQQLASVVSPRGRSSHAVVLVSNDFFINFWLGLLKGDLTTYWHSPYDEVDRFAALVSQMPDVESIWLIIDRFHMPEDLDPYIARKGLAREAYEMGGQWVAAYEVLEYVPPVEMIPEPVQGYWDKGIQIGSFALSKRRVTQGDILRLDLGFSADRPLDRDYILFTHLISPEGTVIAGRDGEPQYGGMPTSTWEPGEAVTDHRAIRIPPDASPGIYQIACGWRDGEGNILTPREGDRGVTDNGKMILGEVEILVTE